MMSHHVRVCDVEAALLTDRVCLCFAAGEGMELMTSHDNGSIHVWKASTEGVWEEYASIDPSGSG